MWNLFLNLKNSLLKLIIYLEEYRAMNIYHVHGFLSDFRKGWSSKLPFYINNWENIRYVWDYIHRWFPEGQSINQLYFLQVFRQLWKTTMRPKLRKNKSWVLYQDSASHCIVRKTYCKTHRKTFLSKYKFPAVRWYLCFVIFAMPFIVCVCLYAWTECFINKVAVNGRDVI